MSRNRSSIAGGFGNSPSAGAVQTISEEVMHVPEGPPIPGITSVKYAGTYPLRYGVTNPPLTTPQFPSNPPRATNKAPIAQHPLYDDLTLTRPTHAMLGALPAGAYRGGIGRVVQNVNRNSGADLRGAQLTNRLEEGGLGGAASQFYSTRPASARLLNGLGAAIRTPETGMTLQCGSTQEILGVATYRIESGAQLIQCQVIAGKLQIKALLGVGSAVVVYTLTGAVGVTPVDHVLPITVAKEAVGQVALASAVETAEKIRALMAERGAAPAPTIDWQDAAVLRATEAVIRAPLRDLYGRLGCGNTCMRQCQQMMDILATAQANPGLQTLRQVLEKYAADRSKSVPDAIVSVVGGGPDPAYNKATNAAVDLEFLADFAQIANVIIAAAMAVIGTVYPPVAAITMAIALASAAAADALNGANAKTMIRAFGPAIRRAALDPSILPARLVGNALVRAEVIQTAGVLLTQAQAGFAGTVAQTTAFAKAYRLLQDSGLEAEEPANGLLPDPAFQNMLRAIRAARPDLCGLSSGLATALAAGDSATWAANNPLWTASKMLGVAAGGLVLFYAFNPTVAVMPAAATSFYNGSGARRRFASWQEMLRTAYAEYTAELAAAPKPLPDPFRARITSTMTALALLGHGMPGRVPGHPEVLRAAGIPDTMFPAGYAEFLAPPQPGDVAHPTQAVDAVMRGQLPTGATNGAMTEVDYNADGAPDSPKSSDPVKKSSKLPLILGGAAVLGGLLLFFRK